MNNLYANNLGNLEEMNQFLKHTTYQEWNTKKQEIRTD